MTNPEAGWYPDPENAARMRYFDGGQWTDHYHDPATQAGAASPVAVPGQLSGAGELFSQAWTGVKGRIGLLLGIAAAAIGATAVFVTAWYYIDKAVERSWSGNDWVYFSRGSGFEFLLVIIIYATVLAIWGLWLLMSSRVMVNHFRGAEPSFEDAWTAARTRCLTFLRQWYGVFILGYIGLTIVALILAIIHERAVLLLIVPVLFFLTKTAFVSSAAVASARTEDIVIASTDLSKGDRLMPIFGRLLMLYLPTIGLIVVMVILDSVDAPTAVYAIVSAIGAFLAWSILTAGTAKLYIEAGGSMSSFSTS